jgi:hypothetical protein
MARQIKFGDIGDYAEKQFNNLLKAAVLKADEVLKNNSPVVTGRFRASWAIGENAAPFEGVPEGSYPTPPPPNAVNYQLGKEEAGNVYSLHNNLIYAEQLAVKGSRRTGVPSGWVDSIAKDLQTYVNAEADRIGREQ